VLGDRLLVVRRRLRLGLVVFEAEREAKDGERELRSRVTFSS
jgi:hypothetical protein